MRASKVLASFTAIGIEFHPSPSLSIHGELGSPIGWKRLHTTIGLGFSLQFGQVVESSISPLGPLEGGE